MKFIFVVYSYVILGLLLNNASCLEELEHSSPRWNLKGRFSPRSNNLVKTTMDTKAKAKANVNGPASYSFVEISSSANTKAGDKHSMYNFLTNEEMMKIESNLKEMFLAQLSDRKKKRYTRENKPCSSAFVQDGITYYDCTNAKSPDGKDNKREWCYLDPLLKGSSSKNWDFCKPIVDYDKVRESNQSETIKITTETRKVEVDLEATIKDGEASIKELYLVRQGQANLDNLINQLQRKIGTLYQNLNFLEKSASNWEQAEKESANIVKKIEVEEVKAEKALLEKKPEAKPITDPLKIRKAEDELGLSINAALMVKEPSTKINCEGLAGYNEEKGGDGLIGEYFDNESWVGSSIQRLDEKINFNWVSSSPIKSINPHNFSIRWTGYVKAPHTGEYNFFIDTNDGAMLSLNDKIIIDHDMKPTWKESNERNDRWLEIEAYKVEHPKVNYQVSVSAPIKLIGGTKYKIVLSHYHSIHNLYVKEFLSKINLMWSSNEMKKKVIPQKYFFSKNSFPNLKPYGFDLNDAVISTLSSYSLAFKNSKKFALDDIPTEYQGLTSLKFNERYKKPSFEIAFDLPVTLYIAVLSHYPNPLPDTFENMGRSISLLQINEKPVVKNDKILAEDSAQFNVFKLAAQSGKQKIDFKIVGANKRGIPMLMFIGPDESGATPISCGGTEELISKPGSKFFSSCSASSSYTGSKCEDGFINKMQDAFGSMWYSQGQGQGAWIKISFKGTFLITKLTFIDRANTNERNKEFELEFSNGSKQVLQLINSDKKQDFAIERIQTQYIIIKISKVYGTINNGGAFNIYGIECKGEEGTSGVEPSASGSAETNSTGLMKAAGVKNTSVESIKPLFDVNTEVVYDLECSESISNSKQLAKINKASGKAITVRCYSSCALTPYMIYGWDSYTKDSAICKAAYHNKKITANGGKVVVRFAAGLKQYDEKDSNGFKSYSKTFSSLTIKFEQVKEEDDIVVKEGSLVDFKNPEASGYLSAKILEVTDQQDGKLLKLAYGNGKSITIPYPNKQKIQACGEQIEGLDCQTSRKNINKFKPINIKFAPNTFKKTGDYFIDDGSVFGNKGRAYGWSKEIRTRVYYHEKIKGDEAILTLVHFPPSPKSRYCKKEIPDTICDSIDWTAKVGEGKFTVSLIIGDPTVNSKIDLSINGSQIVSEVLPKGKKLVIEKDIESKNGFIVLSSNCESNCDFSMAKLSQITISPYKEKKTVINKEDQNDKVLCGGSIIKGKCLLGKDLLHCLFDSLTDDLTKNCSGQNIVVEIPKDNLCKDQIGKFKCVQKVYKNSVECAKFCPNKCKKEVCA